MSSTRSANSPIGLVAIWTIITIWTGVACGQTLAEPAAQVDDGHNDAAQIEHAAYVVRLPRQVRDVDPALDLTDCHDVDAVLVVTDCETDKLCRRGPDVGFVPRIQRGGAEWAGVRRQRSG